MRDLVHRMFRWRIGGRGWLLALGTPLLILAAAIPFDRSLSWAGFGLFNGLPKIGGLGVLTALIFVNGLGEETGWRVSCCHTYANATV